MSKIALHIPTFVQTISDGEHGAYRVRPLFLNRPVVENRRYEQAQGNFKKQVKDLFKSEKLNWTTAQELLWYAYQPAYQYQKIRFTFKLGSHLIDGDFSIISFVVQGQTVVYLPNIEDFMFIVPVDEATGLVDIHTVTRRTLIRLLRKEREKDIKSFNPQKYYALAKEMITEVEVTFPLADDNFKFTAQENLNFFFNFGSPDEEFLGALEVNKVGYNLNDRYPAELRRSYFMESRVRQLRQLIYQPENTPLVIVGKEGIGKHTLIEEVVWQYEQEKGQRKVQEHIHLIDPTRVIAGMKYVGQWQRRFEAILNFLRHPDEENIRSQHKLLIDNPVALVRIGKTGQNAMTLADVLKPYLEKRQLQIVVLATPEEWKVLQEKDRRFADLFQLMRLQEPEPEIAVRMVLEQRRQLEIQHGCQIAVKAIDQLFAIHRNYLKNKALPGTVMKLLTQLAVKYRFQNINVEHVREEFEDYSGLREDIFETSVVFEPNEVRHEIRKGLIGQEKAVDALADVVHLIKAKLTDPSKPSGSFLFIGPTGVGKTQAVKVLCKYLTGNEDNLLRFDMNEFIGADAVQRLIGDAYNPEGLLTGKVRYRPFGIVLLDEIEKAHNSVRDLLLQVLDDGRLTDSLGRTVDFTNNIIIMTSNLGAREAASVVRFGDASATEDAAVYRKAVERAFRPELVNRIDKIVVFDALQLENILHIAELQISELLKRDGFVRRTTILNVSQDALRWVATRGYNPRMGGRALKRQIESDLTALTAEQLIASYSDQPIILDILLKKDRLFPRVTHLEFAEQIAEDWLPQMPDVTQGYRFYSQLIRQLERLEGEIAAYEERLQNPSEIIVISSENQSFDWQHYDFKDKITETKQHLQTLRLGYRDNHFRDAPAIPLRLKGGYIYQRRKGQTKAERESLRDRLFQKEALREVSDAYAIGTAQFDSFYSEFLDNYLNVNFLELYAQGFLKGKMDKVQLVFSSYITGKGTEEINYLCRLYTDLFDNLRIQYQWKEGTNIIQAEGHSLARLLAGEEGIHLFYIAYENPIPVLMSLKIQDYKNNNEPASEVIRIYNRPRTLTDLRTDFTNDDNITAKEFKLLLYAGMKR